MSDLPTAWPEQPLRTRVLWEGFDAHGQVLRLLRDDGTSARGEYLVHLDEPDSSAPGTGLGISRGDLLRLADVIREEVTHW